MAEVVSYTSTDLGSPEADQAYEDELERVRGGMPYRVQSDLVSGVPPAGGTVPDVYPGDTDIVVAEVDEARSDHVDDAVAAARVAFGGWGHSDWRERVERLNHAAALIERDRLKIAAAIAWETGKVRVESVGEVDEVVALFRYYASCWTDSNGFDIPMGGGSERVSDVLRPYGVWGVISPFNFPFAAAAGMIAGAVLGGNTVVYKPDSQVALSGELLHRYFKEALPEGVVQLLVGAGESVGSTMVEHPGFDGYVFTGSFEVGTQSIARAVAVRPRPFVAEMGGKNPVIVCSSADISAAVSGITRSAFGFSGQKCSATSRVYAARDIYEDLVEALVTATSKFVVGDPHARASDLGPVINSAARDRYLEVISTARADGQILVGGHVPNDPELERGYFVEPSIAVDLPLDHPHFKNELFVPYVVVGAVGDLEHAITEANDVRYGLTAGIFTSDEGEIERFFDAIEAGSIYANRAQGATAGAWPGVQAFGGWKGSGSSGRHALGPRYVQQFLREQSRTVAG